MTTTTSLIEHLRNPKERLLDWDLLDEAADLLEAQAKQIEALHTNPAHISKEDMVEVLKLLKQYRSVMIKQDADKAITIVQSAIERMK